MNGTGRDRSYSGTLNLSSSRRPALPRFNSVQAPHFRDRKMSIDETVAAVSNLAAYEEDVEALDLPKGSAPRENLLPKMKDNYHDLLKYIGEDPTRPGLINTPERAAKAMLFFTKGYDETIQGKPQHPYKYSLFNMVRMNSKN